MSNARRRIIGRLRRSLQAERTERERANKAAKEARIAQRDERPTGIHEVRMHVTKQRHTFFKISSGLLVITLPQRDLAKDTVNCALV